MRVVEVLAGQRRIGFAQQHHRGDIIDGTGISRERPRDQIDLFLRRQRAPVFVVATVPDYDRLALAHAFPAIGQAQLEIEADQPVIEARVPAARG